MSTAAFDRFIETGDLQSDAQTRFFYDMLANE
jgi:hypothetical protein